MTTYPSVPPRLVDEILNGRCVAFVGAGLTVPIYGNWSELLKALVANVDDLSDAQRSELTKLAGAARNALQYELAGKPYATRRATPRHSKRHWKKHWRSCRTKRSPSQRRS